MAIPSSGAISLRGARRARRYGNYNASNSVSNVSLKDESLAFGLSAPHSMSELRSRNGLSTGLSSAIFSQNLSSSSSWSQKSHTLSSLYKGRTVRIVWQYINGSSGTSYIGDFQLDDFSILGNTYSPETGTESFQTSTSTGTSTYNSVSFSALGTGGTSYRWNRDASGTGSGGTGLTSGNTGSWYFYAEVSGSSSLTLGGNYWLRSPSIVVSDNLNLSYYIGHLGSNVGSYNIYVDVES
jgi:hypothetical protein